MAYSEKVNMAYGKSNKTATTRSQQQTSQKKDQDDSFIDFVVTENIISSADHNDNC